MKREELDRIAAELIERYKSADPTQKARMMGEAVKYCLAHDLVMEREKRLLTGDMAERKKLGRICLLRQAVDEATQKGQERPAMPEEMPEEMANARIIYSRRNKAN